MQGPGWALDKETRGPCTFNPLSTLTLLLKRKRRILSKAKLTAGSRVAGPSRPGSKVLKLPYLANLYPGFVVGSHVGVSYT